MSVPLASQLRSGLLVNIVLKADQPTGKLTQGTISDILTRGDHPRGIKVRLSTGQIGRVQSLCIAPSTDAPQFSPTGGMYASNARASRQRRMKGGGRSRRAADAEADVPSNEGSSLLDFARISSPPPAKRASNLDQQPPPDGKHDDQKQLESEFPKLDSALVAAILSDHANMADARTVLRSIS